MRRLAARAALAALSRLDPETAHGLAIRALGAGLAPAAPPADAILRTRVAGLELPSPIGVAAGFDKNAVAAEALLSCGFGFTEIGAVTPRPQPGNRRPRLFRLAQDHAAINRFGFNNDGAEAVAGRLAARRGPAARIWANLGAGKDSEDRAADYIAVMRALDGLVGAMTLNISSPNTAGLRDLQGKAALDALLARVLSARAGMRAPCPLFVKIAPDLDDAGIDAAAETAMTRGIDGIVATNTTLSREGLSSPLAGEAGGPSGAPLRPRAAAVLRRLRRTTGGAIPLIGVGGVGSAEDAYARLRAGAALVQLYTAMVYEGPGLGARIGAGLAALLRRDGFASVAEAVGAEG